MTIIVALPVAGFAATPDEVAAVSAGQMDKVRAILGQQQRNFRETCTKVKVLKAAALMVLEPVTVKDGKATAGHWAVRYNVDACGKLGLRMVAFKVTPGGLALEPLVPGETLADTRLQADVAKSFGMAGNVAMPECKEAPVIRDTKVRIRPGTLKDRWQELWVGEMCGRDLGQVVEFLPTKGGTTFKMSLPKPSAKK